MSRAQPHEVIKQARKRLGLSIEQIAEKTGVATGTWSSWECDKRSPSGKLVSPVCQALSITPNQLFGWDPL